MARGPRHARHTALYIEQTDEMHHRQMGLVSSKQQACEQAGPGADRAHSRGLFAAVVGAPPPALASITTTDSAATPKSPPHAPVSYLPGAHSVPFFDSTVMGLTISGAANPPRSGPFDRRQRTCRLAHQLLLSKPEQAAVKGRDVEHVLRRPTKNIGIYEPQ